MNNISKVILGLENTANITLPTEQVSTLLINGIDALTSKISDNCASELKIRFSVKLENYGYYTGPKDDEYCREFLFGIDRYNLVDITLVYSDETELEISLPWEDDCFDFENKLEKLTRFPDGQILIEIQNA